MKSFKTNSPFATTFAENIFKNKYADGKTWAENSYILVQEVCGGILSKSECNELTKIITDMKFIPAGRYLYYAGKKANFYNNCYCLGAEEDTREEWARITHDVMSCLMSGGGIGVDYSLFRPSGSYLGRTGGTASGPISLMKVMNEVGRNVMQGGTRRSALFASLAWNHGDTMEFIHAKNWSKAIRDIKTNDFNFPADLDMTNISVNYDETFLEEIQEGGIANKVWDANILQMLKTAEPGMSFNFGKDSKETLRNACSEFTSEDDGDVCNLGSVNFGKIESIRELQEVTWLAGKFLVCGGYRADLPYAKVHKIREQNRKIGIGLMGLHEWLLKRNYRYEMNPELESWLKEWKDYGEYGANIASHTLSINLPKKYRAVAPTGTIGILASTTTGIEPLYAVAYKRRYLVGKGEWKYEYVIDATAQHLINEYGLNPDSIETAETLGRDPERRIKFQYEVQKYVDMGISSTLNLPAYHRQPFSPAEFSRMILRYVRGLRGITVYPDGARGGQPLTAVPYHWAKEAVGVVYDETEEKCSGGICGI